jgi:hypothetical protein
MKKRIPPITIVLSIVVFTICFVLFYRFNIYGGGDSPVHIKYLQLWIHFKSLPCNFLYYLTIYVVAFFKSDTGILYLSSSLVLSLSIVFKFSSSYKLSKLYLVHFKKIDYDFKTSNLVSIFLFILLFTHPILFDFNIHHHLYLGLIPSNIWHNSTIIFLFPFSLLLFYFP